MLFNVYHDGANATQFTIDLQESVIVKPYSAVRLLKAFIPHASNLEFAGTNGLMLVANDANGADIAINLPSAGTKTIQEVVSELNAAAATALAGVDNCVFLASYDPGKGFAPGCFQIVIRLNSRYYNRDNPVVAFGTAPFDNFTEQEKEDALLNTADYTETGTAFGVTNLRDTGNAVVSSGAAPTPRCSLAAPLQSAMWWRSSSRTLHLELGRTRLCAR